MARKLVLIVLDSVGMGALPDAAAYGDAGADTLAHVAARLGGLQIPNMVRMGLGNIEGMGLGVTCPSPTGCFARLAEQSNGKDTIIGHWEMVGIVTKTPFPVYPNGFPRALLDRFESLIGRKTLGNKAASGTAILAELGEEHVRTGSPIVYTSADSVFQIAAHEEVIPVSELYAMCETARALLTGEHQVARVIARPFQGAPGAFQRTANRHDYAVSPPHPTLLDRLTAAGIPVRAVGKISDIFNGQGVTESVHTGDNDDGMDRTLEYLAAPAPALIFTNLVDFDMKWGHRNDWQAYGRGLEAFDRRLGGLLPALGPQDLLFITADHGCDPTTPGTDHTREYVPLLAYGADLKAGTDLGTRGCFADIGQTIADIFGIGPQENGVSFWGAIRKTGG
jgi:phosphopentomutase